MHIAIDRDVIDRMSLLELDDVRHALRLSKEQLCRRAGITGSTYWRWMRHAAGEAGGTEPHPRLMAALRAALVAEIERSQMACDRIAS